MDEIIEYIGETGVSDHTEGTLELQEQKEAKAKYNDLQVKFTEISEDLDYTRVLFSESRDYEEIKLRNKKLENDLIHSNEKYLNELSKVRENFENQMKFRTTELQREISELRQNQDQHDLEQKQQIEELHEVIETERNIQKSRFEDIVEHFENILHQTRKFGMDLKQDFNSLSSKTQSLRQQTDELETDLKREFSENLEKLRTTLPFVTEFNDTRTQCEESSHAADVGAITENNSIGHKSIIKDYSIKCPKYK